LDPEALAAEDRRRRRKRRLFFEIAVAVALVTAVTVYVIVRDRPPDLGSDPVLAEELLELGQADTQARNAQIDAGLPSPGQELRGEQLEAAQELQSVYKRNASRLKDLVARHGWPGKSLVGAQAADAAWLVVWHAVHDRPFQKHALSLMKEAGSGEVDPQDVALLEDRDRRLDRKKQIYGTEFRCVDGEHQPYPIEDPDEVDERRERVGLDTLDDERDRQREVYGECPD
jgi:hypothetical protein